MIFNNCVDKGIFLDLMENDKVSLFKRGENTDPNNYRPVSLIVNQWSPNYMLNIAQYGVTSGRSTMYTRNAGFALLEYIYSA